MRKAFTIIEVALVVTLIAFSLGLAALYSQTAQVMADLHAQTSSFVSFLRLAQSDTSAGKEGVNHGIHLETDSYTVFVGDIYTPNNPKNILINLPPSLTIQNISLNGGGDDIVFSSPFGETNNYGTVDIVSSQINKTLQVTIDQFGTIQF